jgi:hypothetical protein
VPSEELPNFLEGVRCYFLISDPALKTMSRRFAMAYGAYATHNTAALQLQETNSYVLYQYRQIDTYLTPDTTHMVTDHNWDASFYALQDDQPDTVIVHPEWLEQCHRKQQALDAEDFLVPTD